MFSAASKGSGIKVPSNTVLPSISGTQQSGQTLTATSGTWLNDPTSYAYQWKRSGNPISGATSSSYALVSADVDSTITVTVTATNVAGSKAATSAATSTITSPAVILAPVNTSVPTISGTADVGQTLTSTNGTWINNPTSYAYQWKRSGSPIFGATSSSYTVTSSDQAHVLTLWVMATNSGGSGTATSYGTSMVPAAPGEAVFINTNATWTVPAGVTSVSWMIIGYGGQGAGIGGGAGGGLSYSNNVAVTPGSTYSIYTVYSANVNRDSDGSIVLKAGYRGGNPAPFANTPGIGQFVYYGGEGGLSDIESAAKVYAGGGGAAGYGSDGGRGGGYNTGIEGVAGGGNGAGGGGGAGTSTQDFGWGAGGGGVGLYGVGATGSGGASSNYGGPALGGGGGSNGTSGKSAAEHGDGGNYGGGGGWRPSYDGSSGGFGAVRIIWGAGRSFPNNAT